MDMDHVTAVIWIGLMVLIAIYACVRATADDMDHFDRACLGFIVFSCLCFAIPALQVFGP